MEITSKVFEEDGDKREVVVTMCASAQEVDAAVKEFFSELSQRDIPGFRKGKAPRNVLEQGVGGHEAAYGGVAEKIINGNAFACLDDADILFVGQPEFNVDAIPQDHEPFTFTVSAPVPPAVKLTDYGPVSIEMPPDETTDKEIDEHIDNLRDYYHTFQKVTDPDHVAQMGDYVNVKLTCTRADGTAVRGLMDVERMVGLGQGTMPQSFDEHIVGTKAGDVIEFDFEVTASDDRPEFGDGKLHAAVEVQGFRLCIIPDLDDDFAKKLGSDDVATLRKAVKMALDRDKHDILPDMMIQRCMDKLIERIDGDIPSYFVDVIREDVMREFMQSMEKNNTSLQEWLLKNNVQKEEINKEIAQEAQRRAALDVAIEAYFEHHGMELTDEEIEKTLAKEDDAVAVRAAWEEANRMADLRKLVRQDMVTRDLVKNAQVTVVE